MRTLFLFGLLSGCDGRWEFADTGFAQGDTDLPYNLCEDLLGDYGYPVIIQAEIAEPKSFTILYQEEPEERPCGGMVVETVNGEAWVVGMLESGDWLNLLVPSKPPEQFEVLSWGMDDVPSDPNDSADEDGIYWAGTNTRAQSAKFVQDGLTTLWERQDLRNDEGFVTAYLVVP